MKASIHLAWLVISVVSLGGCGLEEGQQEEVSIAAESQAASGVGKEGRHCVGNASTSPIGMAIPKDAAPNEQQCFDTFAEAISAATRGKVQLSPLATPDSVDLEVLSRETGFATYLISILYIAPKRDAFWGSYTVYSEMSCATHNLYYNVMPNGFNDNISSSQTFPDCHHSYHYDNTYLSGSVIDCLSTQCFYASDMGAMDDRTSSIRWTN